ncbi:protein MALE DISCOVERER 2-like [Zingiber officinale]|nr:protein MALE DISCOVERER 2-like [Zingiber officinale]XP_042450042.1 protein MALE DISCOVERER 2-like [Zingiber officinale]
MGGRCEFQLHKVLCAALMICLLGKDCASINLEGLALLEFRSRVESDPFGALENWRPSDSIPCKWTGVGCVDDKVVALDLKGFSLQGTLAPEIGKLRHLKALVLYQNKFSGVIPKEIGRLSMLEVLDLSNNMLNGTIPREIGGMLSLKHLFLCGNRFQGNRLLIVNRNTYFDLMKDPNLSCNMANNLNHINRKVKHCLWGTSWQKLKSSNSLWIPIKEKILQIFDLLPKRGIFSSLRQEGGASDDQMDRTSDVASGFGEQYILTSEGVKVVRRRLAGETRNLPAAPGASGPEAQVVSVPPIPSGSFPAVPLKPKPMPSSSSIPPSPSASPLIPHPQPTPIPSNSLLSYKNSSGWVYILITSVAALLLAIGICMFIVYRNNGPTTIGPWKTGLSGQLQKAFVTGVPKLNRPELLAACEDFSNIVVSFPEVTIFKGTLSSGVEIAVASTTITSANDWSQHAEICFRKKIDTLSRINHKNFVNLLGYCEENEPFMRMMVLEYAPNGTLFEHLHLEEFEHLDWNARMRIIMGTAYCLQYMHELNPPISHPNLSSSSILVSEDSAAKVVDVNVWNEIFAKGKTNGDKDFDQSGNHSADPASNVYNFGLLVLEVISGKVPYSEEHTQLLNAVAEYLSGNDTANSLIQSTLKLHKDKDLDILCKVIQHCINPDPSKRPSMKEVTNILREVITISPEAATPRLSPLWWAELEILSVEAS